MKPLDRCAGRASAFPSPDLNRFLVSCTTAQTGVIHEAATLANLASIKGLSVAEDAAFSWDGKLLATVHANGKAEVWNVSTGVRIAGLAGHTDGIFTVAFSQNHEVLRFEGRYGEIMERLRLDAVARTGPLRRSIGRR